jgi:putative CocE/NonD family hydrolase
MKFYLSSSGKANTRNGDGKLEVSPPEGDMPDVFTYDPMDPVPSFGGNVCCTGNAVQGGSWDQSKMEERNDILVYSTDVLKEGFELSGPIDVTLFVSSDAKDTDFTVKLIDVDENGKRGISTKRSNGCAIGRLRQTAGLDGGWQDLQS